MFFVTSGFLVTAQPVHPQEPDRLPLGAGASAFILALWVMVALTVFVLGPALTTLPVNDYLRSPTTWEYVWKWGQLVGGVRWSLPGVFQDCR